MHKSMLKFRPRKIGSKSRPKRLLPSTQQPFIHVVLVLSFCKTIHQPNFRDNHRCTFYGTIRYSLY
ncbi:hypothetical protein OUZ56_012478 [Daphnia magna]|uniref:Uncharacterized protein n=1 Tax=Daphnia magna TaxID=35525 RepID=A0ABQ9Z347_9CRUS|nr:hypothetical protein OUZ56_012478 [Daphnia magna]